MTPGPLTRFWVSVGLRFAVPVAFVVLIPSLIGITLNGRAIDKINKTRAEARARFAAADRQTCLGLNRITYRDRQTLKFTAKDELAARLLYKKLGFTVPQADSLVVAQQIASKEELDRRKFIRCKQLPSQRPPR